MYSILIIDDEILIRKSVIKTLTERIPDCTVVGESDNVVDGAKKIAELCPDIIITDICMNQMSGLDMLNHVRTDAKIIVITGYRNFDYAKQAIDMQVSAFLLKPIDRDELCSAVKSAADSLDGKQSDVGDAAYFNTSESISFPDSPDSALKVKLTSLINLFCSALNENNFNMTMEYLNRIIAFFPALEDVLGADYVKNTCIQLLLFIDTKRNNIEFDSESNSEIRTSNIEKLVMDCSSIAVLKDVLFLAVTNIFENIAYMNDTNISEHIQSAVDFINRNLNRNLSLDDVAAHIGLSPTHTSRIFKKETGKTLIEFINEKKIERAKLLLSNKSYKIYEVADLLGFQNIHYFSTLFKKYAGVSPKKYIEQQS